MGAEDDLRPGDRVWWATQSREGLLHSIEPPGFEGDEFASVILLGDDAPTLILLAGLEKLDP